MLGEYRTLLPYYRKYRFQYIAGLLCLLVTNGGQLLIPQYIKKTLNLLSAGDPDPRNILRLVVSMASVALIIALGRFFWRFFLHGASRKIEKNLRAQIFEHLLVMSTSFFSRNKTGDIMARMTNDMRAVRMASGMALVAFVDGVFMTLAILWILFTRYPRLAVVTILPLPVITVIVLLAGSLLGDRFRQVQERFSSLTSRVQETLSGIRVIKTFSRENSAIRNFETDNDHYINANISLIKIWGLMHPVNSFLTGLSACLLLYYGGMMVIWGDLNPGDFVAVLAYLGMLAWPMQGAGFTVNLIQRGAASLKRINKLLDEPIEISNGENPVDIEDFRELTISDLNFKYEHDAVLRSLTLELKAGETLGILGRTGSGKSTLINLLPRLLDSTEGQIRFNEKNIHDIDLSSLRKAIQLIPQETFLFSDTILNNLKLGKKTASPDEIDHVIQLTTMDRDLKNFPRGLETQIGEKGITLSGGQKQRIALARAILSDPQILILDDALSAVDTKTEEIILSGFFRERKGKTNILISHRVSTLMNADRIIVLENGHIAQAGVHEELILQPGLYQKIYKLQSLDKA